MLTGVRLSGGFCRVSTAKSVAGSVPAIVALYVRPSSRVTVILALAPAPVATWLLVRMWPALSMMTPEPWPSACPLATWMATTLGDTAFAVAAQSGVEPLA